MKMRDFWIALAVLVLIVLAMPILGWGMMAWVGGPVAQGAGGWC